MNKILSDFMHMEIVRSDVAEIIYETDDIGRKIRLLGFKTDISKTDFDIREEAFQYYLQFVNAVNSI